MRRDEQLLSAANDLRTTIAELLEVDHADRIILAPGILVALRTLFSHLRIERILLTSEEYYGVEHFPCASVHVARCDAMVGSRLAGDFDAVLASPASWRGLRQPVAESFDSIRKTLGNRAPLLVADYAHAGSIGFPAADQLGADVICGDLEKWILPPDRNTRVAFLWFRTRGLLQRAVEAFRAFFLATNHSDVALLARWVEPNDVVAVSTELASLGVTTDKLRARHREDMKLAREIALDVDPSRNPETSILWFKEGELGSETITALEKLGLAWHLHGRGTRVLCRSDVVAEARVPSTQSSASTLGIPRGNV